MKFLLAAALSGLVLAQKGAKGPRAATVAPSTASPTAAPTPKGKGGKNGKGTTPPPTTPAVEEEEEFSETPVEATSDGSMGQQWAPMEQQWAPMEQQWAPMGEQWAPAPVTSASAAPTGDGGPEVTVDTTCANAGVGALWCAAKQKCLRAWEEPCTQFAEDVDTHVTVKGAATGTTASLYPQSQAQVPLYPSQPAAQPNQFAPQATLPNLYQQAQQAGVPANNFYAPSTAQPVTANVYRPMAQPMAPGFQPGAQPNANLYVQQAPAQFLAPGFQLGAQPNANFYTQQGANAFPSQVAAQSFGAPLGAIGGQRDAGGCATGGGYSFCASLNKCVRPWETPCPNAAAPFAGANAAAPFAGASLTAAPAAAAPLGAIGGQRDSNGCVTGGGYSFCASLGRCVRSWETPCPGASAAPLASASFSAAPATFSAAPLGAIGGQRDAGGCATGGGYTFCAPLGRCVRTWETPCPA